MSCAQKVWWIDLLITKLPIVGVPLFAIPWARYTIDTDDYDVTIVKFGDREYRVIVVPAIYLIQIHGALVYKCTGLDNYKVDFIIAKEYYEQVPFKELQNAVLLEQVISDTVMQPDDVNKEEYLLSHAAELRTSGQIDPLDKSVSDIQKMMVATWDGIIQCSGWLYARNVYGVWKRGLDWFEWFYNAVGLRVGSAVAP